MGFVRGIERCPSAVLQKRVEPGSRTGPSSEQRKRFRSCDQDPTVPGSDPSQTTKTQARAAGPRERTLHMAEANSVSAKVGNQSISLETGRLAKQADGSVVVRSEERRVGKEGGRWGAREDVT